MELSDDIIRYIISFVSPKHFPQIFQTCKKWKNITDNNQTFWMSINPYSQWYKIQENNKVTFWKEKFRLYYDTQFVVGYNDGLNKTILTQFNYCVSHSSRYNRFPVIMRKYVPPKGAFKVNFKILSLGKEGTGFGLISHKLLPDLKELFCKDDYAGKYSNTIFNVGYFDRGVIYSRGNEVKENVMKFKVGDTVSIFLDMDHEFAGQCRFLVNGEQSGHEIVNVKKDGNVYILLNLAGINTETNSSTTIKIESINHFLQ